jgi:hypothetical protein
MCDNVTRPGLPDTPQHKRTHDEADGAMLHAADEPTAVWDAEMLRQAGLSELSHLPAPNDPPPATPASALETVPSILIEPSPHGQRAKPAPAPAKGLAQLSWSATLAIATALGALVYVAIRFLR